MHRTEINVITNERKVIELTPEEIASEESRVAAEQAAFFASKDSRAAAAVDAIDKLQFIHLFDLENRVRALESKSSITAQQYRQALIDRWRTLNE